jgi:DNA-binding response OmpR family regulator
MSSKALNAVKLLSILVVEDSMRMAASLKKGLKEESFNVTVEHDGLTGLNLAVSGEFDIVLLDVNLPSMDGFAFIRELRLNRSDIPVIMVTARDSIADRIEGLDGGADDYLVKPFAFEELLARMRALLRRPGSRSLPALKFADIVLDPVAGVAQRAGRNLMLSVREFSLLRALLAYQNRVLSRAALYDAVWCGPEGGSNIVDVYINYLRNKLESHGSRVIFTVRGRGYVLGDDPQQ